MKEKLSQLPKGKKIGIIAVCAVLVLALLGGTIWLVAQPRSAVDFNNLTEQDINRLYRQRTTSDRRGNVPRALNTLVGQVETNLVAYNSSRVIAYVLMPDEEMPERPPFIDQQFLLTDRETHGQLHLQDFDIQRDMMVHALTKLALTDNLYEVRFTVEFVELPEGTTLQQYLRQNRQPQVHGAYSIHFTADAANRIIGRDIRTVAETRENFAEFMHELVDIDFAELSPWQRPLIRPEGFR